MEHAVRIKMEIAVSLNYPPLPVNAYLHTDRVVQTFCNHREAGVIGQIDKYWTLIGQSGDRARLETE